MDKIGGGIIQIFVPSDPKIGGRLVTPIRLLSIVQVH